MTDGNAQGVNLAVMEWQDPGECQESRRYRFVGFDVAPREPRTAKSCRAVALDLLAARARYDHWRKIIQEIETPEFVQMNDRAGIADDRPVYRLIRLHGVPIGHLPS